MSGLAALAFGLVAQAAPPVAPQAVTAESFAEKLAADGIRFDRAAGEVRVRGSLVRRHPSREYPIEYGLVTEGGFTHEALGIVRCTPSLLNACFLALGLKPGEPRRRVRRDPFPTEEEVECGLVLPFTVLPPQGDRVFIYALWTEREAPQREIVRPLEDLFVDLRNDQPLPLRGFVYLGSRFDVLEVGPEKKQVYIADYEGNVVTIHPDKSRAENCLFDVYSFDGEPYAWSDVDPERLPPEGVAVEFLFSLHPRGDARPFEPEESRAPIEIGAPRELAARSRNPCFDGTHAEWLDRVGTRTLEDLSGILKRAKTPLRETVAGLLGASRRAEAVEPLLLSLRFDRSPEVRLACAAALAEIGSPAALEALVRALETPSPLVRDDALFALRLVSGVDFGRDAAAWRAWIDASDRPR